MRLLLPILVVALVAPGPALAKKKKKQKGDDRAAWEEQILTSHRAYVDAVMVNDWDTAAALFDPDALSDMRGMFDPIFPLPAGEGDLTIGEHFTGKTTEELAALDDAAYFAAFMTGIIQMDPRIADAMASAAMVEKAVAFGDPGTAYVVYELGMGTPEGITVTKHAVTPMVRGEDGRWYLQMMGNIKGLAESLAKGVAAEQARRDAAEEEAATEDAAEGGPEDEEPAAPVEEE